jgi:hypothetical protein
LFTVEDAITAALDNVISFGDTDVFPFPTEHHIFFDSRDAVKQLLLTIHSNFDDSLNDFPPINQSLLASAGYTGFRWVTQIDPVWNVYFLGMVIAIGAQIEHDRIPVADETIFSYRFNLDPASHAIFDRSIGWPEFQKQSLENAKQFPNVVVCDISDFYSHIYHHRVENALNQLSTTSDAPGRIMRLLQHFSGNTSYGLPVGGPAARLLSELLLNRTDRLLRSNGITFCRFADDYHIFATNTEDAHRSLLFLSEKLLRNEGLSLQKSKTRILSSREFTTTSEFSDESQHIAANTLEARRFLTVSLRFDPYSPTAADDYNELREVVTKFDIVGMLQRELQKTRVHSALAKKLVAAVRFLEPKMKDSVSISLVDNLNVLAPVFPNVMILLKDIWPELSGAVQTSIAASLRQLIESGSFLMQIELNLSYVLRVLSANHDGDTEELLIRIYSRVTSSLIKRDIITILARWRVAYWLSDLKGYFSSLGDWEKRSFVIASYVLGDEGRHWRMSVKRRLSPIEQLFREWAQAKFSADQRFTVPI